MRILRRLTHVLIIVLTLVVGAAAAAVIVSQTAWFKNWLRGYIVAQANQYLNGTVSIERLGGNLFFGLEMENIGVSMDGSQVVAVKDLGLDYNVFNLISKGLSVDSIRLDHPVIYLRREGDTWSLSRLVKKQETEADREGPASPIAIDAIELRDGLVMIDQPVGTSGVSVPQRFEHLDAKLSFNYEPVRYTIEITQMSFRGSEPALALNTLSGGISVKDDTVFVEKLALRTAESSLAVDGAVQHYLTKPQFNLQITSDKLSIPEIAQIVPALAGVTLQPAFEIKMNGPMDRLGVDMNVRSSAGQISGKIVADLLTPGQAVAGDVSVRNLDLAQILDNPQQKSDLTADAHLDIKGESLADLNSLHGTVALDAKRIVAAGYTAGPLHAKARIAGRKVAIDGNAAAYGATATVAGNVTLPDMAKGAAPQPIVFDLRGQARRIDLRKMPRQLKAPAVDTNVSADYHLAGSVTTGDHPSQVVDGDARFLPSTVSGAQIAGGSTVGFTMNGKAIGYSADATVAHLDLERIGRDFKVPALATERYKSDINGHLVANGRGTTLQEMDVTASGSLTDSTILGGTIPQLTFDGGLARDTAHVKATGSFAGFDPAVVSGKTEMQGKVGGTLDVDATVAHVSTGVTPDSVEADARVALDASSIGGLEITRANLDGTYHESTGELRTLEIVGRDVNVKASGTIALNETGQSNLKVHADSPSLEELGKLVNVPLVGIGMVDATITGNKRELQVAGNLTGNGVKYGENGALTIASDYTAKVPNLTVADASVTANTHATFVTVGGQNINELDAKTTYAQKRVYFEATAKQPQRSLGADGSLVLHPDHQEVHLTKLGLQAQQQTWQLATGSSATIKYGGDAITVDKLVLTSGDQQITADGSFGRPGDALKVSLTNLDLATVDALMLRPPQLSGRLNATGTVTGTTDAPSVKGEFAVASGGFREYKYDSLGGTLNYGGAGITLDVKLQQNPTTYLTAKGYVPTALFNVKEADRAAAHGAEVAEADRVNLHIESTPIDLGLVQGFTTALTKVTGTVQAKIDITGSAADPHPTGVVTIDNAAFMVEPTGVNYTNLRGQIDLQPDKIHINHISVLDNHQSSMSIVGDLGVHGLEVGGVAMYITASDFKVIDNEMGNVRITSDMQIGGELRAPRIQGDLGVETGRINLDPILALTNSAYATEETEYLTPETAAAAADANANANASAKPAAPSAFDALTMDVHLTVPDDLVVRASELRAPGASIGLGAMNITLGGDLRATKQPGGSIVLVGAINTVRGNYDFQGRRFEILRDGTIRFDNEALDAMDPRLDIRTSRMIQGVEARVNVRGTLKQPDIELSSIPPLEEADILSLIVFNMPINSLGEGQQVSLAQRAQAMATGALAGQLAKTIGNAIGVDTFEISTAPEGGGAASLTIGQQIGQNLYVKVQQGIGDQSQTNFILEYELTRWLRLRTNVLQGSSTQQSLFQRAQGSGADLLFFFSY
jgi:autotransporter translocation and assembly factor TamB